MTINIESTVGQIATEYPLATRVFARHNIDYCCGGGSSLGEVCSQNGLETDAILTEIQNEIKTQESADNQWDKEPLTDLIDHILATYHRPLDEELPRLEFMVHKVYNVHGDKNPEMFSELRQVYLALISELKAHMMKEEQILFPMIKRGDGGMANGPINVMLQDHDSAGNALKRIRELTNNFRVPEEACNTWRALWYGLEALEEALHQHIHLENNILFPRALKS
ncbi:MAG: iron-sulfur cluster repair di-iron protein [Candidatus Marinimicrobia bacterium]|nr:iron-sulfur cluster repair di-iron protein [Candidatus Neomarinimicrobiota bacterium]